MRVPDQSRENINMGYTYEQRKRPQGQQNTVPERTAAPGTGLSRPYQAVLQETPPLLVMNRTVFAYKSAYKRLNTP